MERKRPKTRCRDGYPWFSDVPECENKDCERCGECQAINGCSNLIFKKNPELNKFQ